VHAASPFAIAIASPSPPPSFLHTSSLDDAVRRLTCQHHRFHFHHSLTLESKNTCEFQQAPSTFAPKEPSSKLLFTKSPCALLTQLLFTRTTTTRTFLPNNTTLHQNNGHRIHPFRSNSTLHLSPTNLINYHWTIIHVVSR
jgi:hypothetical protein